MHGNGPRKPVLDSGRSPVIQGTTRKEFLCVLRALCGEKHY